MHIPDTHTETHPGVYERTTPACPTDKPIQESYRNRAETILKNDKRHYEKHAPFIRQRIEEADIPFDHCVAWAGGHPKLEAKAGFQLIDVIDATADMYAESDEMFQELYGPVEVQYIQMEITTDLVEKHRQYVDSSYANTFVHFIEHLTRQQAISLLESCGQTPVIIYGPNVRKAKDKNWFHFKPSDHNTFWTAEALADQLKDLGYTHVSVDEIDEDYLIIASMGVA